MTEEDDAASVVEDLRRIKAPPLVAKDTPVLGYIAGCRSGRLVEVPAPPGLPPRPS